MIWKVPNWEETCHGASAFWVRVANSFSCCLHLFGTPTRSPFTARWIANKHQTFAQGVPQTMDLSNNSNLSLHPIPHPFISEDTCFVRRKTPCFELSVSLDTYLAHWQCCKSAYRLKLINFIFTVYLDHLYKNEDNILFVHIVHAPHSRKYWNISYWYSGNTLWTSVLKWG